MTNPYADFDYMQCRDQQHAVEQFQRELAMMLQEFRARVSAGLDPAAADVFNQAVIDAESDVIGTTEDEVIGALKSRIVDITEENSRADYRAEVRHMTAQPISFKAAI
ncbi:MAG: hypothetical protein Unbinned664contig1000_8 [Prokaryotic dsDNA virus sp.]|nr:MAG: hypothetical protein Unbinned664contig1000_8 [Prokaryotic dsDNA virus sp.]|tara:strand:- start:26554 stop:26877 length:324 start_codon:yes stop_codon:yes gene_type:complete